MKTVQVRFQIEASIEIDIPNAASEKEIATRAYKAVQEEAGNLAADITNWDIEPE